MFVSVLSQIKLDETGDYVRANRKYPPLNLKQLFANRPDVLKVLGGNALRPTASNLTTREEPE